MLNKHQVFQAPGLQRQAVPSHQQMDYEGGDADVVNHRKPGGNCLCLHACYISHGPLEEQN